MLKEVPSERSATSAGQLLGLIRSGTANTRTSLSAVTGLARSTVSQRIDALTAAGLVYESGDGTSSGGRPPKNLAFNGSIGLVLLADLGATQARLGVADLSGTMLTEAWSEMPISAGPDHVLGWVRNRLDGMLEELGASRDRVWAVGIGAPGPVEFGEGRTVAPPIMPGWDGVRIPEWFGDYAGAAVLVDNDVNIMALGEYWTEWRHRAEDLLYVKVGTGIGAGIVAAGQLLRGVDGTAGDIGHIRLADHPDTRCRCGNTGCVESLAGGAALARQLTDLGFEATNSRDVVALVRAGNTSANRLVRDAGRMIGEVLAGAVNFLNPSVIVVGGDIAAADEQLFAGIREVVYERSTALATRGLQIVPSALGDRAGLVGACVLAIEWILAADQIDRRLESNPQQGGLSA